MGRNKSLTRLGSLIYRAFPGATEVGKASAVGDVISSQTRRLFATSAVRGGTIKGLLCELLHFHSSCSLLVPKIEAHHAVVDCGGSLGTLPGPRTSILWTLGILSMMNARFPIPLMCPDRMVAFA